MKLLQILVWILLFMVSYDLVTYFLAQRGEGQPAAGEGGGQWNSIFGYDGTDFAPLFHWLVGGSCLLALYSLRLILKRFVPAPVGTKAEECLPKAKVDKPQRRESFLTCKISDSTINTYSEQNYDVPGQLSTPQLQVLLEELKFSVDEKFEEIDSWIVGNEHEIKLWLKRLERMETELSYIRHQIFILMSSSTKIGSNLCIGDVSDSRDHVETLRDLSTILAQVKKQFNEEESKVKKVKEYEDNAINYSTPTAIVLKEVNENDGNNSVVELRSVDTDQRFMILKEHNVVKNNDYDELIEPKKEYIEKDEVAKSSKNQYSNKPDSIESDIVSLSSDNREDSNLSFLSEKEGFPSSYDKHGPNIYEKWEDPNRIEVVKTKDQVLGVLDQPRTKVIHTSRVPSPISPPRREDAGGDRPSSQKNSSPDRKLKVANQENYATIVKVIDESSTSTNIIMNDPVQESLNESSHPNKENLARSLSPKRTVRFAQDKRDVSPSKTPTWLAIKREPSPVKTTHIKGGSDSKVTSVSYSEVKSNRESASCPLVEEKRPSRRTILEKELTNLERRVSPSPPRHRHGRRSNVRSKVADYIRGNKNQ